MPDRALGMTPNQFTFLPHAGGRQNHRRFLRNGTVIFKPLVIGEFHRGARTSIVTVSGAGSVTRATLEQG